MEMHSRKPTAVSQQPSISVVIPVYNSSTYLADCIESVLQQTYKDFELILVDDGSNDNSGSICDDYAKRDKRIVVIHQSNCGRSEARARGVLKTSGDWVTFVDSDDRLPQDALHDLYAATDNNTDIVLGNGAALSLHPCPQKMEIEEFRHLAVRGEGTIGVPWGSLYRRELLTIRTNRQSAGCLPWVFDVPRHIINGEDYLFWLRLVFLTEKPVHIVEDNVYDKGDEHTSSTFVWTADYCYELNGLRQLSIPANQLDVDLPDIVADRLVNLFSVAMWTRRQDWKQSKYYKELLHDMKKVGRSMGTKEKLFLSLPSLRLRRLYAAISRKMRK